LPQFRREEHGMLAIEIFDPKLGKTTVAAV
jgi:hypothetical protein